MRTYGIDNHLRLTIGNTDENKLFLMGQLKEFLKMFKNTINYWMWIDWIFNFKKFNKKQNIKKFLCF